MVTDEQQGMSPLLERALSEALEEELTRELAPILEPIMACIKARIPAIIENCRLKLMRSSACSEDEAALTPSVVSPGAASSDSDVGSSKKQSTPSRFSDSSFEVVPTPEPLSSKAQGKRPQFCEPSLRTNDMNPQNLPVIVPSGSFTGFGMASQEISADVTSIDWDFNFDDYFDIGNNGGHSQACTELTSDCHLPGGGDGPAFPPVPSGPVWELGELREEPAWGSKAHSNE